MKQGEQIISPIAIDMGAKNTGVYYAKYKNGSSFKDMEKQGQVLVYDKYTALLKDRTAKRHTRRGYQRSKLAKRLLVLVLENYFKFPAKQHSQAIGFLLNRRGFTFLDEAYSKEHLENLPDGVWNALSGDIQNILESKESVVLNIEEFINNNPEQITTIFKAIQNIKSYKIFQENKEKIKKEFVYLNYVEKINKACDIIKNREITDENIAKTKKDKQKLSETSNWIIERLNKENYLNLTVDGSYQTDLIKQITSLDSQQLQQRLPDFSNARKEAKHDQTENRKSIWNFNITQFEFNDKNETGLDELNTSIHLHHFCYAIYKINNEIISGARHRSKYFEEIKDDLKKFTGDEFLNNKHSPKYLKAFAEALKSNVQLDTDKLNNLICHISNFELKPIRAYFNDNTPIKRDGKEFISHRNGDKFNLEKLSRLTSIWFLKNWRVNAEKDNPKKVDSYKELKTAWENHNDKNNIIDFWLQTDPILTIPPYQSMNNRCPPKCQTLLLNGEYLNEHYPQWKTWLGQLEPDKSYKEELQKLSSGKGKRKKHGGRLISDDLIALRQLQFILDTAKKRDKYKLNEIWSIHHKLQQLKNPDNIEEIEKWKKDLEKAKKDSSLPDDLKKDLDVGSQNSFGHFINKYYQTRKKSRDGRYFLIQEKKEKWLTDGKLLTLCTHKPRQKKHQWNIDFAAVLGIDKQLLEDKLKDENGKEIAPEDYFKDIKGFKSACDDATKAQKDYRGELKIKISLALAQLKKAKKLAKGNAKDLSSLANRCYELKTKLIEKTKIDDLLADKQIKEIDQKIALVFKFAQINNIIFKERSGFSKTCPVCSTDNGFRMQEDDKGIANASRLPAMSIRLIDGLVMRICDAVSRQVATTCWDGIKNDLNSGKKVNIPLIFEQNRFEFEPSLAKIKGKTQELTDDRDTDYKNKEERIKDAAQGICAYDGVQLGKGGEIDHIIPQASMYGTLNDEGNLIYVSCLANQNRSDQAYHLNDLHVEYKTRIFGKKTDDEITEFIYKQLEGENAQVGVVENEDYFEFGRYLSFINLTSDQKIAFRHALFLPDNDLLKQKVINALQNRNRTIVNGTQRYMAQCIADKLHKIARVAGKEKQLEFDYFEYSARADDSKSTYVLRRRYGIAKPKKQPLYSHLIDAQLAFLIAAQDHPNDGSMGIKFEKNQTIWQEQVDKTTGEILPSELFNNSTIGEDSFSVVNLSRKKSKTGVRLHRPFHRPNFYAESYVPIFIGKKGETIEVRVGFSWENSVKIKINSKNRDNILSILKFSKNKNISTWNSDNKGLEDLYNDFDKKTRCGDFEVFYIDWDKTKIQKYLVHEFSNQDIADGKGWSNEVSFLRELSYRTQKETIKNPQDIEDVINGIEIGKAKEKSYFEVNLFKEKIELPAQKEWENLSKALKKFEGEFTDFLKHYFRCEKGFKEESKNNQKNDHQKVRKVFSLPVVNTEGHFLQKRRSWNDRDIYQISADSDSRIDGNKFSRLVITQDGELKEVINKPFISKNTFKLKQENGLEISENYRNIDPNKWYEIGKKDSFPSGVRKIEYCIDNKTRPQISIYLVKKLTENDIQKILENKLTKAKENSVLKEKLESDDTPACLTYTASGFNQDIIKCLLKAMEG